MQMFLIQFETHNVVNGIEVDHGPTAIALQNKMASQRWQSPYT